MTNSGVPAAGTPESESDCFQDFGQQFPELGNRGDFEPFVGRMHAAERRTEGDHLQIGILFEEQTALQPGMDGADLGFGAEQPFVGIDGDLQQLRLRVGIQPG